MKKHLMIQKIHRTSLLNKWNLLSRSMKQEASMKDIKRIMSEMGGASSFIKMEATMMGSGKIIKCMDGANSSMKVESWLMREIGLMMNSTVTGRSTMIIPFPSHHHLASTILILTCLMITGNTMRACW